MAVAARSLLAEPRAPGNEETWERLIAKFPEDDQSCVTEAAAAAVAAIFSDPEEGGGPNWRPEEDFDSQVPFEVIDYRNALSGAGNDGLHFSHLQSIIRTGFGRETFGVGIEAFGRKISMSQTPSRLDYGSSSCNPASLPWVKNAAPCVWG